MARLQPLAVQPARLRGRSFGSRVVLVLVGVASLIVSMLAMRSWAVDESRVKAALFLAGAGVGFGCLESALFRTKAPPAFSVSVRRSWWT